MLRYLERVSGYSRAQVKRLVRQFAQRGVIERRQCTVAGFKSVYSTADAVLLAETDSLHGQLPGIVTKKICERMYTIHGNSRYQRLGGISVSHLYNLRRSNAYRLQRRHITKTSPKRGGASNRSRFDHLGRPGFLRIESIQDKNLCPDVASFHMRAVDELTRFQCAFSIERADTRSLTQVIDNIRATIPFAIEGFHACEGAEYVCHDAVAGLNDLLLGRSKTSTRGCSDNFNNEPRRVALSLKHPDREFTPCQPVINVDSYHREFLNPYLNFHRPCCFARPHSGNIDETNRVDDCQAVATPYERLKALPNVQSYLLPGVRLSALDEFALSVCDNDAALQLNEAKGQLVDDSYELTKQVA